VFTDNGTYMTIDAVTTLIYILDIILAFRTTYLDNQGDERYLCNEIASNYIKSSRFLIDTLSLLANPLTNLIPDASTRMTLSFFGILKGLRITRIKVMIAKATWTKDTKAIF
jgi:hypothetical protein